MKTLWLSLLLSSVIWAEEDYFLISPDATWNGTGLHHYNTTWDEARNHCQACFKELTTITSRNVHLIVQNLSLDYWTGLRRSYNGTIPWSRWSNGDPVTYQNWYPGHPLPNKVKKMIPKCFSTTQSPLSTIITATTSTPLTSTQTSTVTSPATQNSTKTNNTDMCPFLYDILDCFNVTCDDLELKVQNYFGFTPKTTTYSTTPNSTTHSTIFTTTGSGTMNTMINSTTTESTTTSNCVFEPEPDPEVYIEDACVVLLSFGMWKEKICNETLPFICYDVRFFGQIDISNVNTHEGNLSWSNPPGNITHYRVEITGNPTKQTSNETALYKQLQGLIPGNLYKVQVFPVKCGRDLNPQNISFYTKPSGVEDLTVVSVTTVSVSLKWSKPVGGRDFYSVHFTNMSDNSKGNKSCPSEECTITDLTPGNEYVFTVSAIVNKTTEGVPMSVSNYTIPSKVTGLTSEDNLSTAIKASWNAPFGNHSSYRYCLKVQNNKECTDCNITTNSEITTDCNNTANSTNTTHCNITTNSNITTDCNITTNNSIKLENKIDGTKYCLCVAALTDGGKLSGEMVVIPAYTEPKTVILSLAPDSQNIKASWTIDGNYERFNVTITTVHDQIIKENTITANLSYTFKNLKAGVQYNVSVITLNGVLRSDTVNSLAYTYPLSPEWAKATSYKTSINVTWGPPKESKEAVILYKVDYYTAFWKEHNTIYTNNTEFTFYELKSGTRYEFNVSVVAGDNTSLPVKAQAHTEPVKETLILTMLCSSQTPLHCEGFGTQDDLLAEMNTKFLKQFGDNVHWKLKWVERSP